MAGHDRSDVMPPSVLTAAARMVAEWEAELPSAGAPLRPCSPAKGFRSSVSRPRAGQSQPRANVGGGGGGVATEATSRSVGAPQPRARAPGEGGGGGGSQAAAGHRPRVRRRSALGPLRRCRARRGPDRGARAPRPRLRVSRPHILYVHKRLQAYGPRPGPWAGGSPPLGMWNPSAPRKRRLRSGLALDRENAAPPPARASLRPAGDRLETGPACGPGAGLLVELNQHT